MKKLLNLLLLSVLASPLCAQQLSITSFQDLYPVLHNPASVGSAGHGIVGGSFRTQWNGMPDGPQTGMIYGQTWLEEKRVGLGGYLYNDVTGPVRYTGLQTAYAYGIPTGEGRLSFGLEARFQQISFDRAKLQASLGNFDPVLASGGNRFRGDAGAGVAYTDKRFQAGFAVSQLFQSRLDLYDGTGTPTEEARQYRHYYLHGTGSWLVDGVNKLQPGLLFVYLPNAPLEVQVGGRLEHRDLFWYGLSWRVGQAWMISAGLHVTPKFHLGYSFDLYTSPLSVYDRGSSGHELMLRYDFLK